jgi:hypothetical protein
MARQLLGPRALLAGRSRIARDIRVGSKCEELNVSKTSPLCLTERTLHEKCRHFADGPKHEVAAIGIGGSLAAPRTGSREAVARLPLPQNVACGFGE